MWLDMVELIDQRYVSSVNFDITNTDIARQDVYEFIQRRSDWKKIEKTVDKTMYNLSFKEDCIIS